MAHLSSNVCAWDEITNADDDECEGAYAYSAESAEEIEEVYEAIIDAILGTTVTLTTTDASGDTVSTTAEVKSGSDQALPFPDGFVCQSTQQTMPLRNVFYGSGAQLFSDFTLTYCPYE